MPRRKSAVHDHFRRAAEQGSRKIERVECVHCGYRTAGNNAARLFKHLQQGCFLVSSAHDPALEIRPPSTNEPVVSPVRRSRPNRNTATPQRAAVATRRPVHAPTSTSATVARRARPVSATVNRTVAASPFLLLNVTVKETKDPTVSRLLAVPRKFTFRNLQRCLSVAFGYENTKGLFDITYPDWIPGNGAPRRKQVCIFDNEEQRSNWHSWDDQDVDSPQILDERFVDDVSLDALLEELQGCKIVFLVGPWAHDVVISGECVMDPAVVRAGRGYAVCLAGEGHPVLENSDPLMWQAFKDAYSTAMPSPTQKAYRMYYSKECPAGDPRGLAGPMAWRWDKEIVNRELRLLPGAANVPSAVAHETSRRVIDDSAGEEDEDEDEQAAGDLANGINHHATRNSTNQHDQIMYEQDGRRLLQQRQQSSYTLADSGSTL